MSFTSAHACFSNVRFWLKADISLLPNRAFRVSNPDVVGWREGTSMLRRTEIGLVLALLVALPATAQDFEKGVGANVRGDYAASLWE